MVLFSGLVPFFTDHLCRNIVILSGREVTAGQRTLSGQKWLLTEQTFL